MLIATQTTLALRCPHCGKLDFYVLSRFACSGGKTARINCECGANLLSICQKGKGKFHLQIECLMCETKHVLSFKGEEIWKAQCLSLRCEGTGVEIGFIGNKEAVMKSVKKAERSLQDIAEELGYDKYFLNPDVMYQVLEVLRNMSDQGRMSCDCGSSQLEVEVYPDRVELLCPNCEAVGIVFAETMKDLQWVREMDEVHLEAHAYRYLDRKRMSKAKKTPLKK